MNVVFFVIHTLLFTMYAEAEVPLSGLICYFFRLFVNRSSVCPKGCVQWPSCTKSSICWFVALNFGKNGSGALISKRPDSFSEYEYLMPDPSHAGLNRGQPCTGVVLLESGIWCGETSVFFGGGYFLGTGNTGGRGGGNKEGVSISRER